MSWYKNLFGGKQMQALSAGTHSPHFELTSVSGEKFSLQDALAHGPVLAVFFKISCPVCQYALPFFERIFKAYGKRKLTIIGVSQNEKSDTAEFNKRYGITFPVLLDDTKKFPVSNAYGLNTVPTSFWIAQDGEIEISSVSWMRQEFEQIARKAAETTGSTPKLLFQPTEQIADFRAG
jgi:peroxiredoxin